MSYVTNVILAAIEHDFPAKLQEVNRFFDALERRPGGFVSVHDESLPEFWYGGTKALEVDLAIGAFNYLRLEELIGHLRTLEWDYPESVQLLIRDDNEVKFVIRDVFGGNQ